MATVDLRHGTLHYHEAGSGVPLVLLHGYLMGANLWDPVIQLLGGEFRCLAPELPFGAHASPMRPDADLTSAGVGRLVADFLQALDLHGVILIGNDSGGAIAQVVAARHPERLCGLILTSCDAFDNILRSCFGRSSPRPGCALLRRYWLPSSSDRFGHCPARMAG